MLEIVLAAIILLSAFLAIYHEQVIYSVVSMTVVFLAISALYLYLGAIYAAVFQLAAGLGTSIVFLLVGRTLSPPGSRKPASRKTILGFVAFVIFLILILVGVGQPEIRVSPTVATVPIALWSVRTLDVIAQSLVILTVAIGIRVVLVEEGEE